MDALYCASIPTFTGGNIMKCFYHCDADGKASGYWIRKIKDPNMEGEYREIDYSKKFPMDEITPDETIYIVDFSISPEEMRQLLKITTNVIWIDHHITAIDKYKNFDTKIKGIRFNGLAGCMLAYLYVMNHTHFSNNESRIDDMRFVDSAPLWTKLISDFDTWTLKYGNTSKAFVTAFDSYDFSPTSNRWNTLDLSGNSYSQVSEEQDIPTYRLVQIGKYMNVYKDAQAIQAIKSGFDTELDGLKCFAMNYTQKGSDSFKSLQKEKYDAFLAYSYNGESFNVSIYQANPNIDVSETAKRYGGGGHKGAAGFVVKSLPFKKIV